MFRPLMFRPFAASCLLVVGLLALTGCQNTTQIGAASVQPAYQPSQLGYAAGGGDMQVVVIGNPFEPGVDDPDFAENMAIAMRGKHFGPYINFTTMPDDEARDNYRVGLIFNAKPPITGLNLCRTMAAGKRPTTSESSGSIPVKMVFCVGSKLLTEVLAHLGGADGITTAKAGKLVGQMTTLLLPPTNPVVDDPLDSDFKPF